MEVVEVRTVVGQERRENGDIEVGARDPGSR